MIKIIGLWIACVFLLFFGMMFLDVPTNLSNIKLFTGILYFWASAYVAAKFYDTIVGKS